MTDRCRSFAPTYVVSGLGLYAYHKHTCFSLYSAQDHSPWTGAAFMAVPTSVNLIICHQYAHRCVSMVILNPILTNKINHHVTFGSSSPTVLGPSYVLLSHPEV